MLLEDSLIKEGVFFCPFMKKNGETGVRKMLASFSYLFIEVDISRSPSPLIDYL
jgi:hypothetical protein